MSVQRRPGSRRVMAPILCYWNTRGIAQPIRLLLNYVEVKFDDVKLQRGGAPDYSDKVWLDVRDTLGLDFPNIPYYIDGDIRLTQSNTILRYLGRKHNLGGETDPQKAMVDLILEHTMDFRNRLINLLYGPNYEEERVTYFKILPDKFLKGFERKLGKNPWFTGDKITVCDFPIYELLDQHRIMEPGCLNEFPALTAFLDRFEALPTIKAYMQSDRFMKSPINNVMANFIG